MFNVIVLEDVTHTYKVGEDDVEKTYPTVVQLKTVARDMSSEANTYLVDEYDVNKYFGKICIVDHGSTITGVVYDEEGKLTVTEEREKYEPTLTFYDKPEDVPA
tara:strand:+ start:3571 stop:3882 length:312 start_codon:yes stop_codon:yes gene_type:complete